jgi:hypothetical protein
MIMHQDVATGLSPAPNTFSPVLSISAVTGPVVWVRAVAKHKAALRRASASSLRLDRAT